MFKNLAENIATSLAANKVIDINNQEIYAYGLELFLFKITLYALIFSIALITHTFTISLTFTVSYMLLRQYTGGYHCKTAERCMIASIAMYFMMLLLNLSVVSKNNFLWMLLSLISYIIIFFKSPVESENKPLEEDEEKKYRIISLLLSAASLILCILFNILNIKNLLFSISFALTADAVLLIISPRRKEHEEDNS